MVMAAGVICSKVFAMTSMPTFADVEAAARRIAGHAIETPLLENAVLNQLSGGRVLIKPEVLQRTGSFKFRGALNRVSVIPEAERRNGVVAFSSGNHAQGVAAAAALFGVPAVIVMPSDAPRAKLEGTRALGAEIVLYNRLQDDREAIASELCRQRAATLVKPFDDPFIVAGQGTVGLEIARDAARMGLTLDAVLSPAGGGGLISGIALALSNLEPRPEVVSVEPENYDGLRLSLNQGARTRAKGGAISVADSLMAPIPGEIPFAVAHGRVSYGLAVADGALMGAVAFAARQLKLVVEPGGAAALAAVLSGAFDGRDKVIAVVLTGGNSTSRRSLRPAAAKLEGWSAPPGGRGATTEGPAPSSSADLPSSGTVPSWRWSRCLSGYGPKAPCQGADAPSRGRGISGSP
jgi:threonine dehydratase